MVLQSFRVRPFFSCAHDPCSLGLLLTDSLSKWLDGPVQGSIVSSFKLDGVRHGRPRMDHTSPEVPFDCRLTVLDVPPDNPRSFTLRRTSGPEARRPSCSRFGLLLAPRVVFQDGSAAKGPAGAKQMIVWDEPRLLRDEMRESLRREKAPARTVDRVLSELCKKAPGTASPPALDCGRAARILAFAAKGTLFDVRTPISTQNAARYAIERCSAEP